MKWPVKTRLKKMYSTAVEVEGMGRTKDYKGEREDCCF